MKANDMTDIHARSASMAGKSPIYLDDLAVGDLFKSGEHAMDEAQITSFAAQFDPQPFHLDDSAARHRWTAGGERSGADTALPVQAQSRHGHRAQRNTQPARRCAAAVCRAYG